MKSIFKKICLHVGGRIDKKFSVIIIIFAVMIVGVVAFSSSVKKSLAGPGYPFGGLIYKVTYCNCTKNYAVYFNDLTVSSGTGGLPLIYQPGATIAYKYYNQTTPGAWILGTFVSGGVCKVGMKLCVTVPTAGTMYMVGSSQ